MFCVRRSCKLTCQFATSACCHGNCSACCHGNCSACCHGNCSACWWAVWLASAHSFERVQPDLYLILYRVHSHNIYVSTNKQAHIITYKLYTGLYQQTSTQNHVQTAAILTESFVNFVVHGGILAPLVGTSRARWGGWFPGEPRRGWCLVGQMGGEAPPGFISVAFVCNHVVRNPIRAVHVIMGAGVLFLARLLERRQGV